MSAKGDFFNLVDNHFPDNVAEAIGADDTRTSFKDLGGRLFDAFGNLDLLETADKTGLVAAINEVVGVTPAVDTAALTAYTGAATKRPTLDGRIWKKKAGTDSLANNVIAHAQSGNRWVNDIKDRANILDFTGIDPKGNNDNTAVIQKAINECCAALNPATHGKVSPYRGITTALQFPDGVYMVDSTLNVPGALFLDLGPGVSYGGARLVMRTNGQHLIHLGKDTDGSSNCLYIRGGSLIGAVNAFVAGTALIYGGDNNALDGGNNSLHLDHVWLQTPPDYAVHLKRGDDFKAHFCLFDVSAFHAVRLGSATGVVTNAQLIANTFYDIRAGAIDLIQVKGLSVLGNMVHGAEGVAQIPYFVNASSGAVSVKNVKVSNNNLEFTNGLAYLNQTADNFRLEDNIQTKGIGPSVVIGGGGVVKRVRINDNTFDGVYSGTVDVGGGVLVPNAPIFAHGTGLQKSRIQNNDFTHTGTGTAVTPMLLGDSRVSGNRISGNEVTGFDDLGQVANPLLNDAALTTTLATIGPATMTAGQRIVAQRVVTGLKPGDSLTLTDTNAGGWTGPNGVFFQAFCGQPDVLHVIIENLNAGSASVPGMNFKLTAHRPLP